MNNLNELRDRIINGESAEDIIIDNPRVFRYRRALKDVEEYYLSKLYRIDMTEGIWYYNKNGIELDKILNYDSKIHYIHYPSDKKWFNNYKGQEIVILHNFQGEINYTNLIHMIDKFPYYVNRQRKNKYPYI